MRAKAVELLGDVELVGEYGDLLGDALRIRAGTANQLRYRALDALVLFLQSDWRTRFDSGESAFNGGYPFQQKHRQLGALGAAHRNEVGYRLVDDRGQGFAGAGVEILARRGHYVGHAKDRRQIDFAPEGVLLFEVLERGRVLGDAGLVDHRLGAGGAVDARAQGHVPASDFLAQNLPHLSLPP